MCITTTTTIVEANIAQKAQAKEVPCQQPAYESEDEEEEEREETSPNLEQWVLAWIKYGVPEITNEEERIQMYTLLLALAGCVAMCIFTPEFAMWYFNPWNFNIFAWLGWFELKQYALNKTNTFTRWAMTQAGFKILGYRETEIGIELREEMEELKPFDYFYLRVNAVPDMVYLSHLSRYIFVNESVVGYSEWNLLNTVVSTALLVIVIDTSYAFLHWVLHCNRLVYTAIHRHHHRFIIPEKNFIDVRNYHPLELVLSSKVIFPSFYLCQALVGASHLSCVTAFLITVVVNCINHSEFDIRIPYIGFDSGDHEMHHRYPKNNMGMCCFWADKLMGTYRPYVGRVEE
eukprot:TRINITY_DN2077_c6_g1_i1.p1 TRINITY_DN2077_c6_g1~~TRINITY_DN2077_c6_g1_i1.p1  ORF type:complete len:346 (+),score=91.05 TRINITY_DN2077_c6_g1_i1:59-1096(+)